jgi:hypothetical protein
MQGCFYVVEPVHLRGAYLVREHGNGFQEMDIHLYYLSGKRLSCEWRKYFDEGLLGSDLSYFDMRVTFPGENADFDLLALFSRISDRWVWNVETLCGPGPDLVAAPFVLDPKSLLLTFRRLLSRVGGCAYQAGESSIFEQRDGIWTPTQILAYRAAPKIRYDSPNYDCNFEAAQFAICPRIERAGQLCGSKWSMRGGLAQS